MPARKPPEPAAETGPPEPKEPVAVEEVEPVAHLTVIEALSAVMGDVQYVSKTGRNTSQNFNFRGIDAVLNAVGPAFRAHGVVVLPIAVESEVEAYQTKSGTAMKNVTLDVTFRFYGPAGDFIEGTARGEAADSGDKATAKAHSVALRTILLQALCIPTDEPDPDSEAHERVHESGFQQGSTADPKPQRERRTEQPSYNWPKNPKELAERMSAHVGVEEAAEWMSQAVKVSTGNHDLRYGELPEADQRVAWAVLTKSLRDIEDAGDLQLHPAPREAISDIFAANLEGQVLAGPAWALSGAEAEAGYPSKESVLAAEEAVEPPETKTLTAEELAAAEAELAEQAREAAESEHDHEQTNDATR